jgi:hypothetical protein
MVYSGFIGQQITVRRHNTQHKERHLVHFSEGDFFRRAGDAGLKTGGGLLCVCPCPHLYSGSVSTGGSSWEAPQAASLLVVHLLQIFCSAGNLKGASLNPYFLT